MNKEELEILLNKMYYDYVDREETQKIIDYIKNLEKENQELKKQLDYLRSGEYYNQLRFENEMLQQVVDTNGVPSEVYDYIDCTHRNTELLKENQKLKKQQKEFIKWLEDYLKLFDNMDIEEQISYDMIEEILQKYKEIIGDGK